MNAHKVIKFCTLVSSCKVNKLTCYLQKERNYGHVTVLKIEHLL